MKASEIIKGKTNDELVAILGGITEDHLKKGYADHETCRALWDFEKEVFADGTLSKGMVILTCKEAALVEAANRWLDSLGRQGICPEEDNTPLKKGDMVYHVRGGTGELRAIEKDIAVVIVNNTCFNDVRRLPLDEVRRDRRDASRG